MQHAPILIFAYNRPEKLFGLLTSLRACPEFEKSPVSIHIDGPKSDTDRARVDRVIEVARSNAPQNAEVITRSKNFGLKRSIIAGVTETLEKYENVIVLEDDLVISPTALNYFNDALLTYRENERVFSIAGYMFNVPALRTRESGLFLPFPNSWGWATWRSRWQRFVNPQQPHVPQVDSASFRKAFDAFGIRDFTSMLQLDQRQLVSSWFINFNLAQFYHGGLTLWPPRSLVSNEGVSAGTHASKLNFHRLLARPPLSQEFLPKLPQRIVIDYVALDLIRSSLDVRLQKIVSKAGGIKRRIRARL